MSRLDDAANSVPSAPAETDLNLDPQDADPNPEAAGDEAVEGEPSEEGKDGRSLDNVRGEFQRKYEKMERDSQAMLAELRSLREELANARNTPSPEPTRKSEPQTLDEMSVEDLEKMRANVPEEQKAAFEAYLIERKAEARVDAKLSKFQQTQSFKQSEQKANEQAFSRWPELHDKSSKFWQVTNRILQEMGPSADKNPRAVLDAANEAGLELGTSPQTFRPQVNRREPGGVQSGRTSRPTPRKDDQVDLSSEEHQTIQNRLANAMPGRKFTKEQLARIAKRTKQYKDNIDLFTRG